MPALRSEAFRDDLALQACLVKDSAHVVIGAKGNHVSRIQKALILIENPNIPLAELRKQLYGPKTAAAVLAYKTKRKIINPAYQKTADNIVGKMTIASLDEEMFALELRRTPDRTKCDGRSGGGGRVVSSSITDQLSIAGRSAAFPLRNAKLSILFQETDKAKEIGGSVRLMFTLFAQARKLLLPHGIDFAGIDGGVISMVGPSVPDYGDVITGAPATSFGVRATSEKVLPGRSDTLRIIFCPFTDKDPFFGLTDGGTISEWTFPKFCLINVRKENPDHGTLLHEMIHAAKKEKIEHDPEARSVFSENIGGRDLLPPNHAESLANAYFSTRRL